MTLDPRTPVIIGVGQVNLADGDVPEPVDLLAEAARRAAGPHGKFPVDDPGPGGTLPKPTMPISGALTIGVPYQPPTAP